MSVLRARQGTTVPRSCGSSPPGRIPGQNPDTERSGRGVLSAAAADPLAATHSLVATLLDVPRGTPPLLAPRVRRLASVSATSPYSLHPGRSTRRADAAST